MSGFNLEKFSKIIKKEISEILMKMNDDSKKDIKAGNYNKKTKEAKAEDIKRDDLKKTLKYYHENVFKTTQGSYFVQKTDDTKVLTAMSTKTFNDVYGQTIKEFHPHILKQDTTRYEVDIYDENFTVDKESKRINLALAFNFAFTDGPLIEEEEEQIKYLLDEFVFKVICI